MIFGQHSNLKGNHAFLSPSNNSLWNATDEHLIELWRSARAIELGTAYHAWAERTINLGIKQQRSHQTLYEYVNDAIGYRMKPEQVLYYTDNCFGTTDAISFENDILRIHDLKTGKSPAHMEQLIRYAALFCLEHNIKPGGIKTILRLYQNDEIIEMRAESTDILPVMDQMIRWNKIVEQLKDQEG